MSEQSGGNPSASARNPSGAELVMAIRNQLGCSFDEAKARLDDYVMPRLAREREFEELRRRTEGHRFYAAHALDGLLARATDMPDEEMLLQFCRLAHRAARYMVEQEAVALGLNVATS
jgi:hypothetical protein